MFTINGRGNEHGHGLDELRASIQVDEETSAAFETLVASLDLQLSDRPLRSLLVTSAQPREGKTTVTLGLALSMAQQKRTVVVVDADLRRPSIHDRVGIERSPGLVDVLSGDLEAHEAPQAARGFDSGLIRAVPSGNPRTAMVDWPRMSQALGVWKSMADVVLIDSAPTLSVSDSLSLAKWADGVLIVLNTGDVTEKNATLTRERLFDAGARILGVAMNRFDEKRHGSSYYPNYRYYVRD